MSLTIYTSNRMELLVEYLAQVLGRQPLPPLVPETVVVQSQGMARWLAMELARRYGVWANGVFPFPNAFLRQVFAQVLGEELVLEAWQRPVLVWRIMDLLPELGRDAAFSQVAAYATTPLKTYQLAAVLADLFDQYVIYRPDFIGQWEAGDQADFWQAELWRRLRAAIAQPHRADLFNQCLARLQGDDCCLGALPPRVALFGISSMPPRHLEVFAALGRHLEVNIFFLNPCRRQWGDILPERAISRLERRTGLDRQAHFLDEDNGLLASMGRLGRDFFSLLLDHQAEEQEFFLEPEAGSLLAALQTDILELRPPTAGQVGDDSLCFVSCHSPMREVEALHDHLLGLFSEQADLEPRDILVMAPDVSGYAPLVAAVFGGDREILPYTVADQSHDQEECIAGFFQILALAASRFKTLDFVALLEIGALRRRFQLSLTDVSLITTWLAELRIRWGRDGADRRRFGLPSHEENTWQAGLDRLLLGFAMGEEEFFAGILPHDGAHLEPELAGRFLALYQALSHWVERLAHPHDLPTWSSLLLQLAAELLTPDQDEERQLQTLRTALAALAQEAGLAHCRADLDLAVVEAALRKALGRDLSPYGFMGGGITFCSLLPMRAVPFKIICLLGMNDGDFPRSPARFGFDLMTKEFRPGDRSMRFDDRYLFLEALLSARQQLYISYLGRSVADDAELAPSVLVREVLEYVARMRSPQGADAGQVQAMAGSLVRQHHLQPFHPDYFQGEAASFSSKNLAAARQLVRSRLATVDFGEGLPLPEAPGEKRQLDLATFQRFWQSPARFFCEQRLGLRLERDEEPLAEDEPFVLRGLDRYELSRDLAQGLLADRPRSFAEVRARGILPHGALAEVVYHDMAAGARGFARQVRELGGGAFVDHAATLAVDDFRLEVELVNVNTMGQFHYRFGKLDGRQILRAWISHLVLNSLDVPAGLGRHTLLLADDGLVRLAPTANARHHLAALLALYWQGLRQPLPFFARTSHVYAESLQEGKGEARALAAAAKALWGGESYQGEWSRDPWLQRCLPEKSELGAEFRTLAQAVYQPLWPVMTRE